MEWYTFGLDRIIMFLVAFVTVFAIILTIMFQKSVIERGPKKYIDMT
jgi:hypothetical protein